MQQTQPQENELKETVISLKNSGIDYLKSKSELAAIESKEAASFAKKKISVAAITAFFGLFTYAIFLILAHSLLLQHGSSILAKIQKILPLTESQIVLLAMLVFHLFFLLIYLMKLSKKPKDELFALTKSEFKKDQVWLNEMNNNAN